MNDAFTPKVHVERCTRYRYRYSECSRCADTCPHDAVQLSEEGVSIAATACRHCGLCLGVCATDVFESGGFSRPALVRAAMEAKTYTVTCAPSGASGDVTIPCLGALDAATVAFVLSRGSELNLVGLAHCAQCAHGAKAEGAIALLVAGVEHARVGLDGVGWGRVILAEGGGSGVDRQGSGRRQFFRRLVSGGAARLADSEGATAVIPSKAVRAAPHYQPLQRELVGRLLGDRTLEAHPAFPAARLVAVADACTACELCDRVCPTGALQSFAEQGWWQLQFRDRQCVGCGVCIEACRSGALTVAGDITAAGNREGERLIALCRHHCERCGRLYVPANADASCPVCDDDDLSFSAIFG